MGILVILDILSKMSISEDLEIKKTVSRDIDKLAEGRIKLENEKKRQIEQEKNEAQSALAKRLDEEIRKLNEEEWNKKKERESELIAVLEGKSKKLEDAIKMATETYEKKMATKTFEKKDSEALRALCKERYDIERERCKVEADGTEKYIQAFSMGKTQLKDKFRKIAIEEENRRNIQLAEIENKILEIQLDAGL